MGPMVGVIGRRPDVNETHGWRSRGTQEGMESWDGGIEGASHTSWKAKSELPIGVSIWEETPRPIEKQRTDSVDMQTIARGPGFRATRETTDEEEARETIDLSEPDTHALPARQNELPQDTENDSPRVRSRGRTGEERKIKENNKKPNGCKCRARESIKVRKRAQKKPYLPSWLWKRWTRSQLDKLFRTAANCSLLLSIGLLLTAALLQLYHLRTQPQRMILTDVDALFANDLARKSGLSDPTEINLDEWTFDPAHPLEADIPKAVLDSIDVPTPSSLTPAIIGIRHMVPLAAGSSPEVREYLGKAISVSFRLPSGRIVHHRGDIHLRLFEREPNSDWVGTPFPSRTELDFLRGILFREEGLSGLMNYLRKEGGIPMERWKALLDDEARESYHEKEKARKELDLAKRNSQKVPVKIGPPTWKRPGNLHELNNVTVVDPTLEVPNHREQKAVNALREFKEEAEEEAEVLKEVEEMARFRKAATIAKIKVEGDEGRLYRMGLLSHSNEEEEMLEMYGGDDDDDDLIFLPGLGDLVGIPLPPNTLAEPTEEGEEPAAPRLRSIELPGFDFKVGTPDEDDDDDDIPLLEVISPNHSSEDSSKTTDEILGEIMDTLKKLRLDFASAIDVETRWMAQDLELGAEKLLKMKEEAMRDKDGDVEMGGRNDEKDPVPEYQPELTTTDPYRRDPAEVLKEDVDAMGREVRNLEWRIEGTEHRVERKWEMAEARIVGLETTAKEMVKGRAEAWPSRQKPIRDTSEYHGLRGRIQKIENRIQGASQEIGGLRARVVDMERAVKEVGELRRKVNGLDVFLGSVHGEVIGCGRRVAAVEVKQEEGRLRLENGAREAATNWAIIHTFLPRVGKIDAKLAEVDYRLITVEEQSIWLDQKARAVWLATVATDLTEKTIRCNGVRTTWNQAAEAFNRRLTATPYVSKDPRHPETGLILASTTTPHSVEAVSQPTGAN